MSAFGLKSLAQSSVSICGYNCSRAHPFASRGDNEHAILLEPLRPSIAAPPFVAGTSLPTLPGTERAAALPRTTAVKFKNSCGARASENLAGSPQ